MPLNETARRNKAAELMNAMAPFAQSGIVDMSKLAAYVLQNGFGINNPEAFLSAPKEPEQPAPPPQPEQPMPPQPMDGMPMGGPPPMGGGAPQDIPPELLAMLASQQGGEPPMGGMPPMGI